MKYTVEQSFKLLDKLRTPWLSGAVFSMKEKSWGWNYMHYEWPFTLKNYTWITKHINETNLYYILCSNKSRKGSEIQWRSYFYVDIDYVNNLKEEGKSVDSIDWELEYEEMKSRLDNAEIERVRDYYMIVFTWNWWHAYYKDKSPIDWSEKARYKKICKRLFTDIKKTLWDWKFKPDTAVWEIARLARLPLTTNINCSKKHWLENKICEILCDQSDKMIDKFAHYQETITTTATKKKWGEVNNNNDSADYGRSSDYETNYWKIYNIDTIEKIVNVLYPALHLAEDGKNFNEQWSEENKSFFINHLWRLTILANSRWFKKELDNYPPFELVMNHLNISEDSAFQWFEDKLCIKKPSWSRMYKERSTKNEIYTYKYTKDWEPYRSWFELKDLANLMVKELHIFSIGKVLYIYNKKKWIYVVHTENQALKYIDDLLHPICEHNSRLNLKEVSVLYKWLQIRWYFREFEDTITLKPNLDICLDDCIYNAKTGRCRDYTWKEFKFSKLPYTKKNLRSKRKPKIFLQFLDSIFKDRWNNTQEIIDFMQEYMWALLVSNAPQRLSMILNWSGSNGKWTIFSVMKNLLGKENYCSVGLWELDNDQKRMLLLWKLASFDEDMDHWIQLDKGLIKKITVWESITWKTVYQSPVEFEPFARLIMGTNNMPYIKSPDHACYRRFVIINLNQQFSLEKDNIDPDLKAKLKNESKAIFAWSIVWLKRLMKRNSFEIPWVFRKELRNYIKSFDTVQQFLDHSETIEVKNDSKLELSEFHEHYKYYCRINKRPFFWHKKFARELRDRWVTVRRDKRYNYVYDYVITKSLPTNYNANE